MRACGVTHIAGGFCRLMCRPVQIEAGQLLHRQADKRDHLELRPLVRDDLVGEPIQGDEGQEEVEVDGDWELVVECRKREHHARVAIHNSAHVDAILLGKGPNGHTCEKGSRASTRRS